MRGGQHGVRPTIRLFGAGRFGESGIAPGIGIQGVGRFHRDRAGNSTAGRRPPAAGSPGDDPRQGQAGADHGSHHCSGTREPPGGATGAARHRKPAERRRRAFMGPRQSGPHQACSRDRAKPGEVLCPASGTAAPAPSGILRLPQRDREVFAELVDEMAAHACVHAALAIVEHHGR